MTSAIRRSCGLAIALTAILLSPLALPRDANGRPNIRDAFFAAYPSAVGTVLDNVPSHPAHCGVCHYLFDGSGTRNRYGRAVEAALPNYPNNPNGKKQAILSIQNQDSDGDGYTNLAEITDVVTYVNTPTFPGLQPANVDSVTAVDINDLLPYLVPTTFIDVTPPTVTVTSPNGGESWAGGSSQSVTWTASDDVAVASVDVFYRDREGEPWTMIARSLANTGSFTWFVHNTPTDSARVKVLARDGSGNAGADSSDTDFTILPQPGGIVPTTLRDFMQPGTQPFGAGTFNDHSGCLTCHGGYDPAAEPGHAFEGMMMAQAARDPLFYACLAIAEQDAPSSGDLCLRCHTPIGWLSGHSQPTSGAQVTALDRDGVSCEFCHRVVDPVYKDGVSPPEDQAVLAALLPAHQPTGYSNGQYVVDPNTRRRGPYGDPVTPHAWLESPLHRSSEFCGTCHDVSNPVFTRVAGADYAPGPLDQPADSISSLTLLPLERTYSEWKHSAFALSPGVYAPDFAGVKPDGYVSQCQDCHMADVSGKGCNDPAAPLRSDLGFHDLMGGNAWLPTLIATLYPSETNASALADGATRARTMLGKAASLDLQVQAAGDSFQAVVTVTNRCGHKLPTGYPEGRRMWLHVVARDQGNNVVYESGAYDAATGVLAHEPDALIYEVKLGLSPALAGGIALPAGESFHFALNDTVYKDNRIPPQGFANVDFARFGGAPVDPSRPSPRYADGQNWDVSTFGLPASARSVAVALQYQTTSKEYVEFLKNQNTTTAAGLDLYNLWTANGRSAPVVMVRDSAAIVPVGVTPPAGPDRLSLRAERNPFRDALALRLTLARPAEVRLQVFDVGGRRVAERRLGRLEQGVHRLLWDGRDAGGRDVGAGIFWARVLVDGRVLGRQVVRLQ